MQSFDSFRGLFVIKSKKKHIILKTNIYNKMNENNKNSKIDGKKIIFNKKIVERSLAGPVS